MIFLKKLTSLFLAVLMVCGIIVSAQSLTTDESVSAAGYPLRDKTDMEGKRGVYYEIFVRSFADSDGDGVGDFNGVTAKLDYLKELGIEGIWLMPVNESNSYHGYDVTDYYTVNSDYGTEADFKNMLSEAHKRGIKVIMDFVINHTSSQHPWFVQSKNVNSPYRDYYTWVSGSDPDYNPSDVSAWGSRVWNRSGSYYYYGMFSSGMPDLNYENPKVREEVKNAAKKWLEFGIDGFRLDAAMHIYGNNEYKHIAESQTYKNLEWWNEFAIACEEVNPDVYLVGEAWQGDEALAEYAQPFDTKFDFAFQETLTDAVQRESANANGLTTLSEFLQDVLEQHYAADSKYLDGVFGSNHDQNRIMSTVKNEQQAKMIASIYMTLDGNPYIYYGEEIGMKGAKPDEKIREPFKWSADLSDMDTTWEKASSNRDTVPLSVQKDDPDSMYSFYKKLIAVRKSSTALTSGKFEALDTGRKAIMGYTRTSSDENVVVLHNFSGSAATFDLALADGTKTLMSDSANSSVSGSTVTLDGYASLILRSVPETLKPGDATGNGKVDVQDAIEMQKHMAGMVKLEGKFFTAADVDKNGSVEVADVLLVQKYLAGMIAELG